MEALANGNAAAATRAFYAVLRREVIGAESALSDRELELLRDHYPVMMQPDRYPPGLVTTIYVQRRSPAVAAILDEGQPRVLDAGCGFGSECFLFAAAGAEVLGVDRDPQKIAIARQRQSYYEKLLGRRLAITFRTGDLDELDLQELGFSLTWMASVLANVGDQEDLLRRLCAATRPGGRVMLTDMNLLNPLFVFLEWRRRRRAAGTHQAFAREASFADMFWRRNRRGARYFKTSGGRLFDDAQFFWWQTLARLLRRTGFEPRGPEYSGFVPPLPGGPDLSGLERALARIPMLRGGGYFYLMTGVKP